MTEVKVRVHRRIGAIIVDMVLTHHRRVPRTPSSILRMDVGTTHSEFSIGSTLRCRKASAMDYVSFILVERLHYQFLAIKH